MGAHLNEVSTLFPLPTKSDMRYSLELHVVRKLVADFNHFAVSAIEGNKRQVLGGGEFHSIGLYPGSSLRVHVSHLQVFVFVRQLDQCPTNRGLHPTTRSDGTHAGMGMVQRFGRSVEIRSSKRKLSSIFPLHVL
jgi:hypothetical protein